MDMEGTMTYPHREDLTAGRTVTLTDAEWRIVQRLVDLKWEDLNRYDKTEGTLSYLQDLETLQGKLR